MSNKEYDPHAWLSNWPKHIPIWDAHREVHCRFGVAAQKCSEIETPLAMLVGQMQQAVKRQPEFTALLSELTKTALPLGPLIDLFCRLYRVQADDDLAQELEKARKARNYLVHHFYRDSADLLTSPEGCRRLEDILISIHDDLDAARQALQDWRDNHLGYTASEDIWDRINEDVARWKSENQQMLDALLGKSQRRG
jgi:hypothetical protein